jgi:hypothetical protein
MVPDLVLAVGGMTLLASGVWWIERMALRRPIAYLLCACGIVLIAIAAARSAPKLAFRMAALGMYSTAGLVLGATTATVWARRHAGAILASLGMVAMTGFKITSAVAVSVGMLAVFMQAMDAHRSGTLLMLVGQGLFFATLGIRALTMVRAQWSLADQGIIGPDIFVPWRHVSAWRWQDSNTLAIELKPGFLRPRRLTISVAPEAHERSAAILATKLEGWFPAT